MLCCLGSDLQTAKNLVSTAFPSVQASVAGLSYLSYGGFMAGWAALSVGLWDNSTEDIRDGEYGGPLVLFNTNLDKVVILSSLNNYMVSSLYHDKTTNSLQWGLMGSVESVPVSESLRTVLVFGRSLEEATTRWGEVLQLSGVGKVKERSEDVVTNKLGYWCDNGAFYYYHTLPDTNYEDTIIHISKNLSSRLPVQYINYDSWWYIKGKDLGTKSWTPQQEIFPHGMESLYNITHLPVVAHNR